MDAQNKTELSNYVLFYLRQIRSTTKVGTGTQRVSRTLRIVIISSGKKRHLFTLCLLDESLFYL